MLTLRGNGTTGLANGTFAAANSSPVGMVTADLVAHDFNADGVLDLAVTGTAGLRVLRGSGVGGHAAGPSPGALAVVDRDPNGLADVVVANATSPGTVSVLLGRGAGTLADRIDLPTGGDQPADRGGVLELVDLQGRRLAAVDLAGLGAGTHSLELLNGRTVPAGLSLVRLLSGGERRTAKIAVVR